MGWLYELQDLRAARPRSRPRRRLRWSVSHGSFRPELTHFYVQMAPSNRETGDPGRVESAWYVVDDGVLRPHGRGWQNRGRLVGANVRIYSRRSADFTKRYPRIVAAALRLRAVSALLDGEGIVYDQHGMPDFNLIHSKECDREVGLVAFDLLELNGEDVRPQALTERKRRLQFLLTSPRAHRAVRALGGRRCPHLPCGLLTRS